MERAAINLQQVYWQGYVCTVYILNTRRSSNLARSGNNVIHCIINMNASLLVCIVNGSSVCFNTLNEIIAFISAFSHNLPI